MFKEKFKLISDLKSHFRTQIALMNELIKKDLEPLDRIGKYSHFGPQKPKCEDFSINIDCADIFNLHSKRTGEICSRSGKQNVDA